MELLSVDSLEQAREKLIKATETKGLATRKVGLEEALGCILPADIVAPVMVPEFRRSTVDGYGVLASDTWGASESSPVFLKVLGEVSMGQATELEIKSGECVYVPTGGMLPAGADSMVMVEYCEVFGQDSIMVYGSVAQGENVVQIGEDVKVGEPFLKKGSKLGPGQIGALAAVGIKEVEVCVLPSLTIISTGDELIAPGMERKPGQIYDINTSGLQALADKYGLTVTEARIVRDDEKALYEAVNKGMATSDMVLVSGGSSQGKKDRTKEILDRVATPGVFTHGLALKPGKPTILGYDELSETILIGLPGHPVAAMMVFQLLAIWYLEQTLGMKEEFTIPAKLAHNLASSPGRTTSQPVTLEKTEAGYLAYPVFGKSVLITSLSEADGYMIVGNNREGMNAGESVEVYLL